jgi:TDG/mug DNA glycosylase family protein
VDQPTVAIYEAQSGAYEARRTPTSLGAARAFRRRRPAGPVADLGCGPGFYTAALGPAAVALDAALALVRRTRETAPGTLAVQGDLSSLPFRRGSLAGGWARSTYVHLLARAVPMALNDLHHALQLDAPVELTFFGGEVEGRHVFPNDDFPGRWFSTWSAEHLRDVVVGAGFAVDALDRHGDPSGDVTLTVRATRARGLPDFVGPEMRLLVTGLNPSERSADAGIPYMTPGNRFWGAALAAGIVTRDRDPRHALAAHGIGITDLVKRPTPRADGLMTHEYREGVERLDRLCTWLQPAAVCMVGLAGWRAAVDRRATAGWQARPVGGRPVYVMPSTSGLNAATPPRVLAEHLRTALAGR